MSTLKVNKLRDTAGAADGITLDPNGGAVLSGVTTMTTARVTSGIVTNTFIVGAGVTISESGIEASGIGITCANINGAQIGGRRNMIINGDMNIAQRGTPTAASSYTTAGYGACDRWRLRAINTDQAAFVVSQESDVPTGSGFIKSIKIATSTVETSLDSNEIFHVSQPIEAQDLQHLNNGNSSALPVTLSFWVKAYQTGTYVVNLYKPDNTQRQITATYTISDSNTWEFKTMTFPGDTSGGGIADDTGTGFQIYWILAAGSNFTGTTSTSWGNYADGGFANGQTVNIMSSTDNYHYLTGVQLEIGEQATPFEHRTKAENLLACKRYYQDWSSWQAFANKTSDSSYDGHVILGNFEINMRANPTIKDSAGAGYKVYGRFAGGSSYVDGSTNEAAAVHHDSSATFPGRWFLLTGTYNWNSGYNDTIAVKFHDVVFDAEL